MENNKNIFKIKIISLKRSTIKKNKDNEDFCFDNSSNKNTKKSHAEVQKIYSTYNNIIDIAFILLIENNNSLWIDHFKKLIVDEDLIKWDLDKQIFIPLTSVARSILSKYKFWIIGLAYLKTINNYDLDFFLQLILNSRDYKIDDEEKYNENLILLIKRYFSSEEIRKLINKLNNKFEEFDLNYNHYKILLKEMTIKLNDHLEHKSVQRDFKRSYSMSSIENFNPSFDFEKMKEYLNNIPKDILLKFRDIIDNIKKEKNIERESKITQINISNRELNDDISQLKKIKQDITVQNQISILINKKFSLKPPTESDIKKLSEVESDDINIKDIILDDGNNIKLDYFIDLYKKEKYNNSKSSKLKNNQVKNESKIKKSKMRGDISNAYKRSIDNKSKLKKV